MVKIFIPKELRGLFAGTTKTPAVDRGLSSGSKNQGATTDLHGATDLRTGKNKNRGEIQGFLRSAAR